MSETVLRGTLIACMQWFAGSDTGMSSKTLCCCLAGIAVPNVSEPRDAADFGRCHRLVKEVWELERRLDLARDLSPVWNEIVNRWTELCEAFEMGQNSRVYHLLAECRNAPLPKA